MDRLVYLLPALGCAAMMGAMMWMMMRRDHGTTAQQSDNDTAAEIAALRAEIAALRDEKDAAAGARAGGQG